MGMLTRKFPASREQPTEEPLLEDVRRNVGYLLRAKRGAASFHPLFGLSETGFRTVEEMLGRLSEEIRENLRLFEPRLEILEIEEDHDGPADRPRLVLHCRLKSTRAPLSLIFTPHTGTVASAGPASQEKG
jgi:predicted component of type VI protein secretion system